jgi:hypothetical protein
VRATEFVLSRAGLVATEPARAGDSAKAGGNGRQRPSTQDLLKATIGN